MTRAGLSKRLNRRIAIELPARTPNGSGGFIKGWSAPRKIWAEMIPLRGGEAVTHALQRSTEIWKVTIRYRPDANTDCRITSRGEILNIRTCVDPDGSRTELVLTCESGTES